MPSQGDQLAGFLRARYTEAQEQQHRIFRGTYRAGAPCPVCEQPTESMTQFIGDPSRLASFEPCRHVVNDPALMERFEEPAPDPDVLADLDAKLAIVGLYETAAGHVARGQEMGWPHNNHQVAAVAYRDALMRLAVPFAAHPDYDERWRP